MKPSRPAPLRARRRGSALLWIAMATLVAAAVGFLVWSRVVSAETRVAVDPDRVVVVEERDVIDSVTASGRVEPLARVAVMSRAGGILTALHADEGDRVREGQVLAELDREQLRVQLERDEADLLAADARLEAAKARLAEARVRASDPEPEFLRREAKRLEELFGGGDASLREKEEAARALANAEFRVRTVEATIPVLEATIAEAEAQVTAARAARDRSATALDEATVYCPIDGVVLVRDKEVGDGVSSILTAGGNATQIMTLGDLSSMHVEARVDEVDLGRIHAGMDALVTVDAHRGKTLRGSVERIAPAGSIDDNGIVTFQVDVSVADPEGLLRPDMTADAKLVIARRDGVASLPQIALRLGEDGEWTADRVVGTGEDARVERVRVVLGLSDGLMTEVHEGLAPGDRVLLPPPRSR